VLRSPEDTEKLEIGIAQEADPKASALSQYLMRPGRNGGKLRVGNPHHKGGNRWTTKKTRDVTRSLFIRWLKWAHKQMQDDKIPVSTALAIGNIAGKYGIGPANGLEGLGEGVKGVILLPVRDLSDVQKARELARLEQAKEGDYEVKASEQPETPVAPVAEASTPANGHNDRSHEQPTGRISLE
jgi:hypothetical protein